MKLLHNNSSNSFKVSIPNCHIHLPPTHVTDDLPMANPVTAEAKDANHLYSALTHLNLLSSTRWF